ncbi:multidrug ABC transporter ATP-binding protein [Streptomyces albireticuli]|uniref:Fatty acid ABC transporter ATP-binding/permease protein n=2 Tax=Streptomyces TaxID=1883 RepID=A0A1Z2L2T0_9ACTN|nr:multidrug ABC transporter ATP-binding protein [Streptomyces albireticuli]
MTTPQKPADAGSGQGAGGGAGSEGAPAAGGPARRGPAPATGIARFMGGQPTERSMDFAGSGKRLLGTLRPERALITVALLLTLASVALSVIGPKILGHATDLIFSGVVGKQFDEGGSKAETIERIRRSGDGKVADLLSSVDFTPGRGIDFDAVGQVLLWVLLIYVGASLFGFVQARIATVVVQRAVFRLREQVEEKLGRLPLSYFDKQQRGEVLSRATNDIDNIAQTFQQTMSQIVTSLLTIVGVLAVMFWISWLLALVALVTVPVSVIVATKIGKRAQPQFVAQWKTTGTLNAHIEEMYTGHALVKVFGRQKESAEIFRKENDDLYEAGFKAQFISGVIQPAMMFIGNLNYVLVAVVGGLRVASGALSIGDVQAFVQYSRQFSQPLTQVASMANLVQSGVASAERVFELLDAEEQSPDTTAAMMPERVRGEVAFEDVSFRYEADKPLIDDLSLTVRPGQTVAIVGPTGAGKTTLVNLLMRFYEVNGGRITLDGVDVARMSREELRSHIGMVLQDTWLFGGTIAENIAYGAEGAPMEKIVEAARATHVDRFVRTLPDGYDTVIDEEGSNVSVGEKQLITIARAFLAEPSILVLDEATSSVDTRTEVLIQHAMAELRTGRTSFVIAHRLSTIRDADVILVMESGRIVEQGTHDSLLAAEGAYARLYAAQFAEAVVEGKGGGGPCPGPQAARAWGPGARPGLGSSSCPSCLSRLPGYRRRADFQPGRRLRPPRVSAEGGPGACPRRAAEAAHRMRREGAGWGKDSPPPTHRSAPATHRSPRTPHARTPARSTATPPAPPPRPAPADDPTENTCPGPRARSAPAAARSTAPPPWATAAPGPSPPPAPASAARTGPGAGPTAVRSPSAAAASAPCPGSTSGPER